MDSNTFNRMIDPFKRKLSGMAARALVKLVSDGGKMQALQLGLLDGELADGVERFQNYGMTSHPHPGAEAAVIFLGADRGHSVSLACCAISLETSKIHRHYTGGMSAKERAACITRHEDD